MDWISGYYLFFFGRGTVAVSQSRPPAGSNSIDLGAGTSGLRADVGNLVKK